MKSKISIPKYCRGLRRRLARLRKKCLSVEADIAADKVEENINSLEIVGDRLENLIRREKQ